MHLVGFIARIYTMHGHLNVKIEGSKVLKTVPERQKKVEKYRGYPIIKYPKISFNKLLAVHLMASGAL